MGRTVPSPLERAQIIARAHHLRIVGKRNSRGGVQEYRVFRALPDRLVWLGSRTTEAATLVFVERLARSE